MKKLISLTLLLGLLVGCTSHTQYGDCVGVDSSKKDPNLVYDYSIWNVALAIIFSETIIVPLVVIFKDAQCPSGPRPPQK